MARPSSPKALQVKPLREADLSEEDSVDIFFSFDVTALAYLGEQRHSPRDEFSLARLPAPARNRTALERFQAILSEHTRNFLTNPVSYGYLLVVLLSLLVVSRLQPLQELAVEKITSMIPPELTITKPPPPKPEPVREETKKEAEPPPKPEPVLSKPEPEPVPEPEKPVRQPLQLHRNPLPPAETPMQKIAARSPRQVPESRPQMDLPKREEVSVPGLSVEAPAARTPEIEELQSRPSAQPRSAPAPATPVVRGLTRLEDKKITPIEERQLKVGARSAPEHRPASPATVEAPVAPVAKRTQRTESRLATVFQKRQQTGPVDQPAPDLNIRVPAANVAGARTADEVQGAWQRMENLGPLAHLNALCFGRLPDEFVYHENFRLRCENNQIIEGWRRNE